VAREQARQAQDARVRAAAAVKPRRKTFDDDDD